MAWNDMTIIIDGVTIAIPSSIKKIITPNKTTNITLGGTRYTDYQNNLRQWVIGWEYLTQEDYDVIYNLYLDQYENSRYAVVRFEAYDLSIPCEIEITDTDLIFNGGLIKGFSIKLYEQYAFS